MRLTGSAAINAKAITQGSVPRLTQLCTVPRWIDDLWAAIAEALKAFTPTECENYFVSSGYDPQ